MIGINAAVAARSRVEGDRVFDSMVSAILSALWEGRPPEDVDLAGLGFEPAAIARHRDAATREARDQHDAARAMENAS